MTERLSKREERESEGVEVNKIPKGFRNAKRINYKTMIVFNIQLLIQTHSKNSKVIIVNAMNQKLIHRVQFVLELTRRYRINWGHLLLTTTNQIFICHPLSIPFMIN